MAGTGKQWAIGCGVGCGLMLIILGGLGTMSYFTVKELKERADGLDTTFEELQTRFGDATDFVPRPDGVITAGRMETFLIIRDDMAPFREEMSDMLHTLDGSGNWIAKAQAGLKLVPALLGFIGERNEILVSRDMGVGEYQYIYALSYFVLLAKDPADGPSFVLAGDDEAEDGNVHVNWGDHNDEAGIRESRAKRVRAFVNDVQVVVLDNQLAAYRASLPGNTDLAGDSWGAALSAELAAMRLETLRFPWEEGLPEQIRSSLAPYRDRLDATYDPMTSIIEMGLTDED